MCAAIVLYGIILKVLAQAWQEEAPKSIDDLLANPTLMIIGIFALSSLVMALFVLPQLYARRRDHSSVALRQNLIVRWAMLESIAIFGLIGAFLVRDERVFYALGGLALFGMLLMFPSDERLTVNG